MNKKELLAKTLNESKKIKIIDNLYLEYNENGLDKFYSAEIDYGTWSETKYYESIEDVSHYCYCLFTDLTENEKTGVEISVSSIKSKNTVITNDEMELNEQFITKIDMFNYKDLKWW